MPSSHFLHSTIEHLSQLYLFAVTVRHQNHFLCELVPRQTLCKTCKKSVQLLAILVHHVQVSHHEHHPG